MSESVQRGIEKYGALDMDDDRPEFTPGEIDSYKTVDLTNSESIQNPGKVDEALWAKAKRASQAAFGEIKYAFVTWWYKHHGGKFS